MSLGNYVLISHMQEKLRLAKLTKAPEDIYSFANMCGEITERYKYSSLNFASEIGKWLLEHELPQLIQDMNKCLIPVEKDYLEKWLEKPLKYKKIKIEKVVKVDEETLKKEIKKSGRILQIQKLQEICMGDKRSENGRKEGVQRGYR